ncbi:MAG: hypothetical protein ABSF26_19765 [Thermoguttaceae bacterium]
MQFPEAQDGNLATLPPLVEDGHPAAASHYEVPEILAILVLVGGVDYRTWLDGEVIPPRDGPKV